MTIRAGLRLMLLSLAAVFLGMGVWTIDHTGTMDELNRDMSERLLPLVAVSGGINTATSDLRIAELMHIGSTAAAEKEALEADQAELRRQIDDLRGRYAALLEADDTESAALLAAFNRRYDQYLAISGDMMAMSRQNRFDEAVGFVVKATVLFKEFSKDLDQLVARAESSAREHTAYADDIYQDGRQLIFAGVGLVLALCALALWGVERRVAAPLADLTGVAQALADGRLADTASPLGARRDEVGELARAVIAAADAVQAIAGDLRDATQAAAAGALSARADATRHRGDYAELAVGVNRLVDTLTRPLQEVAAVMRQVAAGDIDNRMTGAYEGDLRALKANLNRSLDTVVGLLGEVSALADGLSAGRLTVEINGAYQGAFADIKGNVNHGLAAFRDALLTISVNIGQVAAAAVETAAAGNQVADLAAGEKAAHQTVEDMARLADDAHALALNAGISGATGGNGFATVATELAGLVERISDAARRLDGAGVRADGADNAAAAAQIGAAMGELARMVDEIRGEIQRFELT